MMEGSGHGRGEAGADGEQTESSTATKPTNTELMRAEISLR